MYFSTISFIASNSCLVTLSYIHISLAFPSNSYLSVSLLYRTLVNKSRRKPCTFNEIVLCTMKSEQARMKSSAFASDEIKSASPIQTKSDFIAKRFHPTQVGFLPPSADLVEKSTHCLGRQMCAFFWRRMRDLNSRAGYPTYTLSRGASSPLE